MDIIKKTKIIIRKNNNSQEISGTKYKLSKPKLNIICPEDVIDGSLINKEKRHKIFGRVSGGIGSLNPEIYQRKKIIEGTGIDCTKTNIRINLRTNELKNISYPNTFKDGFDYSEDFDGLQVLDDKKIYLNLKCIVGSGGSQTRSLREVYWFIEGQLNILQKTDKIYFGNILDGDEANKSMNKFEYIISLREFSDVKNKIYVGDLKGYFEWFRNTLLTE